MLDANIVNQFFRVELGYLYTCTACPRETLEAMKQAGVTFVVDDGQHLVSEWRSAVDPEWFENWFMTFVQENRVEQCVVATYHTELKELRTKFGFPSSSDRWLIRVALSDASRTETGPTMICSEDMDLFDPKYKSDSRYRDRIMSGAKTGSMAKHLQKKWGVQPCSASVLLTLL